MLGAGALPRVECKNKYNLFGFLFVMYFIQAIPFGMQSDCIPVILRSQGSSLSLISSLKITLVPWVLKPLYAPYLRTSRSWFLRVLLALAFTCFVSALFTTVDNMTHITIILFILNLLSASQDILVDSMALQLLPENLLSFGNTIQVVSYKLGTILAGGGLLYLYERVKIGWNGLFIVLTLIYIIVSLWTFFLSIKDSKEEDENSIPIFDMYKKLFKVPGTQYMICFLLFYKICDRLDKSIFLFEIGVIPVNIAFWIPVVKIMFFVGAIIISFVLLQTSKFKQVLLVLTVFRAGILLVQWIVYCIFPYQSTLLIIVEVSLISLSELCGGAITTMTFTMMMKLSQTASIDIQKSHYATMATCEIFGKLLAASLFGWFIDLFGMALFLAFLTICGFLFTLMVSKMPSSISGSFNTSGKG